jgi:hypothetical protein
LDFEEDASVADGCEDFTTMTDDAYIGYEFFDFCFIILTDGDWIEVIKREAEVFSLGQDYIPGESGLKAF